MSVSLTLDAVRDRSKTVTRRHFESWRHLRAGDRLTLIEKGMGLPKGAKQVVVCEVEIVDVRAEALARVLFEPDATKREGLAHMSPEEFIEFWLTSHGHKRHDNPEAVLCRRIEWRYLDTPPAAARWEQVCRDYIPCRCSEDYTGRGLQAPDCWHHDALDMLDAVGLQQVGWWCSNGQPYLVLGCDIHDVNGHTHEPVYRLRGDQ